MKKVFSCGFVVLILCLMSVDGGAESLQVRVLDVGEGQSVLLQKNNRAILIDTGHAGVAGGVAGRLRQLQISSLDHLLLTHLHPDHASGLFRILEEWPQAKVADPCYPVTGTPASDMLRWVDRALQQHRNRRCLAAGDGIDWQGVSISVLWPLSRPAEGAGINNNSLVLEVRSAGIILLIMGDAGKSVEQSLLDRGQLRPVDVLVVGHHGADDASGDPFLAVIKPKKAVISTNANNVRGYPSSQVIKRLEAHGAEVFKTYEDGEIDIAF